MSETKLRHAIDLVLLRNALYPLEDVNVKVTFKTLVNRQVRRDKY